jgi:hypothetical protein
LAIDLVVWTHNRRIVSGGTHHFAAPDALYLQPFHQALDSTTCHRKVIAIHLSPHLVGSVDLKVGVPDTLDLRYQLCIPLFACTAQCRVTLLGSAAAIP